MPPAWLDVLRAEAREAVPSAVWTYVESGAGEGVTTAEANDAWRAVRFRPRMLRGGGDADLTTTLLGASVASPIGIAPTAMQRAVHPEGERAMAAGASASGALHIVSSNSGTRFGDLGGSGPWWLQAYLPPDREQFRPVVAAAVAAGARAVVLTVDTPYPGTKRGVDDEDWSGIDLTWWRSNYPDADEGRWKSVSLDDVGWLREAAGVPVVVKGVLRADDTLRCLDAGADAVYVSNHGGRQLDRAVSTATALREVAAAAAGRAEVYVDGGVRSGADVLAALALGARGVFVGRPALWALAAGGAPRVESVVRGLQGELRECLELAGCPEAVDATDLL